tara:strand:- start:1429 stop:3021 length:1593 start_codon:yes stop_codon:yes gene_type:complete
MCGIFAYLGLYDKDLSIKQNYANKIKHRGPDNTITKNINDTLYFHFHRLMINGLDDNSNQPFHINGVWLICNGEIYNYRMLVNLNSFDYQTNSDCEVIIHMYLRHGIEKTCQMLDGVFAFVLYDENKDIVYVARDHLGIRPLYIGREKTGGIAFASEAKSLTFMNNIEQFPPRTIWNNKDDTFKTYYEFPTKLNNDSEEDVCDLIRGYLTEAIRKRFTMSDVEVGCLLSGGLDSSIVTSICSRMLDSPSRLKTFSIGLKGSPDLLNAQVVADYLRTNHYSYEVTEEEFIKAIDETIYCLGTYDITTIRASVGHMLVSRYVSRDTNVKVLFSGEVADELGSYLYFMNAPSEKAYQQECIRLLSDIHYFDGLRSDRSISFAGIESRVPFSDKEFLEYYLSINPKLKMFNNDRIEKYLIRKAFSPYSYLPDSVLWRRKNGFSDSVSNKERSWSVIIAEHIDTLITDEEFKTESIKYRHNTPKSKEAYYYRKKFSQYYNENGVHDNLTPYMWLPKWCGDVSDPSARVLNIYKAD